MNDFTKKFSILANKARGAIAGNRVARRIISATIALSVILSPLTPELTVFAAENVNPDETIEETASEQTEPVVTEAILPTESLAPDFSNYAVDEPLLAEDEDIDVTDPSDSIDTTAPPTEQIEESTAETTAETSESREATETSASDTTETTPDQTEPTESSVEETAETTAETEQPVEETKSNIVMATSADEYFDLVSKLPDGYQRLIVDTKADLSTLVCADGVYYDGTYMLVFDDADTTASAIVFCDKMGYQYAIDGTLGLCGDFGSVISYGAINPAAKTKVAVIDTGSNLANERYSVIGDDVADHNGHGTAMCDFILNETADAYIISIKAIGENGRGNMTDVYVAVQLAEELGVSYILMAISIRDNGQYDAFRSLIENTKATVFASAGNSGADASGYLPAGISNVMTIGAINSDFMLSFSNYGTSVDYYVMRAGSTSEAAATALGWYIRDAANMKDILGSYRAYKPSGDGYNYYVGSFEYFVTDSPSTSGDGYEVYSTLDGSMSTADSDNCIVYYDDYITGWDNPNQRRMYVYYEGSSNYDTWDKSVYCIEWDQTSPASGKAYYNCRPSVLSQTVRVGSYTVTREQYLQAIFAFGPGGRLSSYAKSWLDSHDTSGALKDHGTYGRYILTHILADIAFDGETTTAWGSTAWMNLVADYAKYIVSVRMGGTTLYSSGHPLQLSNWWVQVCQAGQYPDSFQKMAFGNVSMSTLNTPTPTPTNSPTPTPTNSPTPTPTNSPTPTPTNSPTPTPTNSPTPTPTNSPTPTPTPKAYVAASKTLGKNYQYLRNRTYSFVLCDNTANVQVATGTAVFNASATNNTTVAVTWSNIASGYASASNNRVQVIVGHTYELRETVTTIDGRALDTPSGWSKSSDGTYFYKTFTVSADNTTTITLTNDTTVPLTLTKASTNTAVTSGNSAYSLAGAKYDLATDINFSNKVGTFTMKADGTSDRNLNVVCGTTYYLKESAPATGFELDTAVYKIVIAANGTASVSVQSGTAPKTPTCTNGNPIVIGIFDKPKETQISLTKSSADPTVSNGNSCYTLNGTTYKLYPSKNDANVNTNALVTFTVNANGITTTTYTVAYGTTYYLKETIAGKGYNLDANIYTVTVSASGVVSVDKNVTTTKSGNVYYMDLKDAPGRDPFSLSLRKVDKNGNVVHNASFSGAKFRISYYAQDLGATGNNSVAATVIYEYTLSGDSVSVKLSDLKALMPVGGSDPNYLKNVSTANTYPFGTIRVQEISAPVGYMLNDQVVRIRLLEDGSTPRYVENNSSYGKGNKMYWEQLADGTMQLTELPEVGYYSLKKSLEDTTIRSSIAGFKYELYNTSSKSTPVQIATGVSQADGRVLWTYTLPNNYSNTDTTNLLTGTTTYNLELLATEKNASGAKVAIQYQVRELKSSIAIAYGASDIPYTYSVPTTNGTAWNNATDYFYKAVTVDSSTSVKQEGVVNNYEFTGINVNKVVPAGNPFDITKVTFKLYNTDSNKLIANGTVDSKGNVTWNRVDSSGYGVTPVTSVNTINNLPLGHYRVEETWAKDYVDGVLIEEQNNSGWTKTETATSYTYSKTLDLTAKSNDGKITSLAVENEKEVQKFNLTKEVTVAGDASTVTAQLYRVNGGTETLIDTGTAKTNGVGTYGFTWTYSGEHTSEDDLDTLILPVGTYRIVETCPVTYYKNTQVPYTYATPAGFTARTINGQRQFYKDFTLSKGDFVTEKLSVTNVRIEGSFKIVKVERSGEGTEKAFTFEVYYRGNGSTASSTSTLINTVKITTVNGKGSVSLSKIPEGWYEIREVGADSKWTTHWLGGSANKVFKLTGSTNAGDMVCYNDVAPEIKTTLVDRGTADHVSSCAENTVLEDTVSYKHLQPGHYVLSGVLMDKNTGKPVLDKNGKQITGSTEFDVKTVVDEYGEAIPQSGSVKVTYTLDTTTINNVTVVAFEELHASSATGTLVAKHTDINDVNQTVYIPDIHTTLVDSKTNDHVSTSSATTKLVDTVTYKNLIPGKEYTVIGTLMNKATGKSIGITATKTFKPTKADGTITIEFTVDTTKLNGVTIVAFETVKYKNVEIAVHTDINDVNQTVQVPDIRTSQIDKATGDKVVGYKTDEILVDTVSYSNLIPDKEYTVTGTLYNKAIGKSLGITASKTFKPEKASGTIDVEFTVDSSVIAGVTIVAFESLKYKGIEIAVHADINDKEQAVYVPEIKTTLLDSQTKDHVAAFSETAKLVDTVYYKNLVIGKEYTVTGVLMDKKTGAELKDVKGNPYAVSKNFTAESSEGTVDIEFVVDTTNINDVTVVAFENIYYNDILIAVHTDINDVDQTVYIPEIKTTLKDKVTDNHVAAEETVTLVDTVKYSNLLPGKEYTVKGILVNADTGVEIKDENDKLIIGTTTFTPEKAEGSVEIVFKFSSKLLQGIKVVAFEDVSYTDIKVATHADITDENQTVYFPEIHTTLVDSETEEHVAAQNEVIKLVDTVTYDKLKPGLEYTMRGTLMDKTTGEAFMDKDGNPVISEKTFTPEAESGIVEMEFEFDGSLLKGDTLVAFEECYLKDKEVATHVDIEDVEQTVDIPDIHTTFFDLEIGDTEDFVRAAQDVTLVDRVYFTNLNPGLEYTLTGTVMVRETGEAFKDEKGDAYITTVVFTPEKASGYVDVEFVVNTELVAGQTLVAFETLDYKGITLVIHADIEDIEQTVHVPEIKTHAADADNGTQTLTYKERVTIVDTVSYKNLVPRRTYVVEGTIYNATTGEIYKDTEGKTYTAMVEFTAEKADGFVKVVFENVLVPYTYTKAVVFENLYDKTTGIKIAMHSDIEDEDQTFERPVVGTTATVDGYKEIWLGSTEIRNLTITDTISYTGLEVGSTYRAEATLFKADGTQLLVNGQPLKSIVEFTPATKDGTVDVNITFSTEGLSEGDKIVVFEKIYDVATEDEILNAIQTNDLLIARHEDLTDSDQTILIHFRPSTGEIISTYVVAGAVLTVLSALLGIVLFRRKKFAITE